MSDEQNTGEGAGTDDIGAIDQSQFLRAMQNLGAIGDVPEADAEVDEAEDDAPAPAKTAKGPGGRGPRGISEPDEDDGEEESDVPAPASKQATSNSRLILNITNLERDNTALRGRERDLARQNTELKSKVPDFRGMDRVTVARTAISLGLGLDPNDPKVNQELTDLIGDLFIETADEASIKDVKHLERFRQDKADRARAKADAAWRRSLEAKVEKAEQEKASLESEALLNGARAQVSGYLTRDAGKYPFLMEGAEGDPHEMVAEAVLQAINSGEYLVKTEQDEMNLVAFVASNFNEHYKGLATRLAPKLQPKVPAKAGSSDSKSVVPVKGTSTRPKTKTASGTGGGGRGRPVAEDPEETDNNSTYASSRTNVMDLFAVVNEGMQREHRTRRGR